MKQYQASVGLVPSTGERPVAATVVLVDGRALVRECLTHALNLALGETVIAFADIDGLLAHGADTRASLVVLSVAGTPDAATHDGIFRLAKHGYATVILADAQDPDDIAQAIERGARGYIPTCEPLDVFVKVMRLVRAGGIFVPAKSLMAARQTAGGEAAPQTSGVFTPRQAAVIDALRRGKPNKIIAYELDMRESTVKVHVRNIMKKLNARNRTEVAFLANAMAGAQP